MDQYMEMLLLHPLETKSITSFTLFAIGDLIA